MDRETLIQDNHKRTDLQQPMHKTQAKEQEHQKKFDQPSWQGEKKDFPMEHKSFPHPNIETEPAKQAHDKPIADRPQHSATVVDPKDDPKGRRYKDEMDKMMEEGGANVQEYDEQLKRNKHFTKHAAVDFEKKADKEAGISHELHYKPKHEESANPFGGESTTKPQEEKLKKKHKKELKEEKKSKKEGSVEQEQSKESFVSAE